MATETGIIDAWMQHPTKRFLEQPFLESLLRWMGVTEIPEVPLEFTIGSMDAAGVAKGLVCAWWGPQGPLIPNDDVARFVEQYPDRLIGVAAVDLHRPMDAVRELRRCVREHGFKGLRIVQWLWNLPPNDRRYYPLYAECVDLGVPACLQIGHTGPMCPSEPGRPIPYFDEVLLEFPELTVVAGHIGYPWIDEVISLATKYPNFYIDTSAHKTKRYPADFVEYLRGRGRKKVLFGTNYPMITHDACLAELDTLGLDEETKHLFLRGNAERVFDLSNA
jgi:uncharacterized protein